MTLRLNGSTSGYTEITGAPVGGNSTAGIVLPSGSTSDRPTTASAGQIRFNTTTGKFEYWSSTSDTPQWLSIQDSPINVVSVDYYIVGGGGGGGGYNPYSTPAAGYFEGTDGGDSRFNTAIAGGGGGGASGSAGGGRAGRATNGSGGAAGAHATDSGGAGNGTGNAGGSGNWTPNYHGGGGGGAGGAGGNASGTAGAGGIGATRTFITTAQATANSVGEVDSGNVYFAGGGSGGPFTGTSTTVISGGLGGGGDTVTTLNGEGASNSGNATANTGGGGGGYANSSAGGGGGGAGGILTGTTSVSSGTAIPVYVGIGGPPQEPTGTGANGHNVSGGGSGVVILKYPATKSATFSSGVTANTITDGNNKITFVTATTDQTQTVTFG